MEEEIEKERDRIIKILMKYHSDIHPETGEYLSDPQHDQVIELIAEEIKNPKEESPIVFDNGLPF